MNEPVDDGKDEALELPDLQAALVATLAQTEPPSRRATQLASGGMLAAGAGLLTLLFWQLGWFTPGDRPLSFVVGTSLGWLAIASAASWLGLGRGGRMSGRPVWVLVATALGAPVLLFGWLALWNLHYGPAACPAGIGRFGSACHQLIVVMSAVMFSAFVAIRRFGSTVHPRSSGAALGVAAASWAGLVLNLRCTCATLEHVFVGHVAPLMVASVLGIAAGGWLLRFQRSPLKQ